MSEDILDYADLVRRYETGLVETLRSFGFQSEYLELWVPDEDLTRSLLNLFDAAAEVGHRSLAVRIPSSAIEGLKTAGLPALAATRGIFSIETGADTSVVRMRDLHVDTATRHASSAAPVQASAARQASKDFGPAADAILRQPQDIAEPYRSKLAAAGTSLASDLPSGFVTCRAEIDGLTLGVAIDQKDHIIRGIAAQGAKSDVMRRLLTTLAGLCIGLPILEAADHGAIKLEYSLRTNGSRPRSGIVIAEGVDPAFNVVSALMRAILADYRKQTGFKDVHNSFDVAPGPRWMQADEAGRRAQLEQAFGTAGLAEHVAKIVAIEYDVRVVVALSGVPAGQAARMLTLLERAAKERVDPRLELFLSELKDSNKLRRLSEYQDKAS